MTRLMFVATAFAVGMATFAVEAKEPPAAVSQGAIAAKAGVIAGKVAGQERQKDDIDPITTSAVSANRPEVKFKARKGTRGLQAASAAASGGTYSAIVARYASEYGIPASLADAVIMVESNYQPDVRGRAGEVGLMQIKPSTARGMGYKGTTAALFDPETNIRVGMLYLAKAHDLADGDICGTILRYNAGHNARRMNKRSAAYCAKVKRHIDG